MAELRTCAKCGKKRYCHEHHILPKGLFGDGETVYLCPNCHDDFHRYLGYDVLRKENKKSTEFYLEKWYFWLHGMLFVLIVVGIYWWMG